METRFWGMENGKISIVDGNFDVKPFGLVIVHHKTRIRHRVVFILLGKDARDLIIATKFEMKNEPRQTTLINN